MLTANAVAPPGGAVCGFKASYDDDFWISAKGGSDHEMDLGFERGYGQFQSFMSIKDNLFLV